jgi:hypothetical protein
MNNSKKLLLVIVLLLLGASLIVTNAQTEVKKAVKDKLEKLDGDVSSIVIKTDEGEVEFTGEEAEHLFKKMKGDKIWISAVHGDKLIELEHDINSDKEGDVIFVKKMGDKDFEWSEAMAIGEGEGTTKKIKINVEDGEKKVTVTTTKDGEESVETYEGEEAEKFLEEMDEKHGVMVHDGDIISLKSDKIFKAGDGDVYVVKKVEDEDGNINVEVITGGEGKKIFIHEDSGDDLVWTIEADEEDMEKEVKVEVKDGVKTVTVKTIEDGEEKVEVFTGAEADEYIEKMKAKERMMKSKKMKKYKIKIEEEDEDEEKEEN